MWEHSCKVYRESQSIQLYLISQEKLTTHLDKDQNVSLQNKQLWKGIKVSTLTLLHFFPCQVYDYLQKEARAIFGPDLVSVQQIFHVSFN